MGRSKKYITQEEREEADKRDKRKCYHKHKEYCNLLSKRAYYNKCLSLHPDKVEHYQRLLNEANAEIERIKATKLS